MNAVLVRYAASPTVLVTGASSYLAHRLIPIAGNFADVAGTVCSGTSASPSLLPQKLDVTNAGAVQELVADVKPDAIIHTAALNPGGDEASMKAINHWGSRNIALAAAANDCRLVMVSSDVVHNGRDAPYIDNAVASPINVYGHTKAAGERAVLDIHPRAMVVRTSLIYGLDKMDRGTRGFATRLQSGQTLTLFDNVLRQPVWIDSLSVALCRLAVEYTDESGYINIAGDEVMSRADFGKILLQYWQIDGHADVTCAPATETVGLPLDLRLDCHRATALGFNLPGVTEVLSSRHSPPAKPEHSAV